MFFLGFVTVLVVLATIIAFLTKLLPDNLRSKFVIFVIAIPVSFPFWHYLYPSYYTFQELCNSPECYVVRKVVEVDFLNEDGCWRAFKKSQNRAFKGFECAWQVTYPAVIVQGDKPYARFVRGDNWDTPACQDPCVKANYNTGAPLGIPSTPRKERRVSRFAPNVRSVGCLTKRAFSLQAQAFKHLV